MFSLKDTTELFANFVNLSNTQKTIYHTMVEEPQIVDQVQACCISYKIKLVAPSPEWIKRSSHINLVCHTRRWEMVQISISSQIFWTTTKQCGALGPKIGLGKRRKEVEKIVHQIDLIHLDRHQQLRNINQASLKIFHFKFW